MKKRFLCSSCGSCCSVVGQMVENARKTVPQLVSDPFQMAMVKLLIGFPFDYDASGRCTHLNSENKCDVYESRPLVCDVARLYKKVFQHVCSRKEFYKNNHLNCKILQGMNANSKA